MPRGDVPKTEVAGDTACGPGTGSGPPVSCCLCLYTVGLQHRPLGAWTFHRGSVSPGTEGVIALLIGLMTLQMLAEGLLGAGAVPEGLLCADTGGICTLYKLEAGFDTTNEALTSEAGEAGVLPGKSGAGQCRALEAQEAGQGRGWGSLWRRVPVHCLYTCPGESTHGRWPFRACPGGRVSRHRSE